jgi:hypothetical protein
MRLLASRFRLPVEGIRGAIARVAIVTASLVVWLCSDGAAYTAGSTMVSNGGLLVVAAERNDR